MARSASVGCTHGYSYSIPAGLKPAPSPCWPEGFPERHVASPRCAPTMPRCGTTAHRVYNQEIYSYSIPAGLKPAPSPCWPEGFPERHVASPRCAPTMPRCGTTAHRVYNQEIYCPNLSWRGIIFLSVTDPDPAVSFPVLRSRTPAGCPPSPGRPERAADGDPTRVFDPSRYG